MIKIKKADSMSILKDGVKKEKEYWLKVKDSVFSLIIKKIEKISPNREPVIAKKLLHALDRASFFLKNKEPIAPMKNSESKIRKLICDVIISNILLF